MALINCPECGKTISDKAKMCPHCGVNIEELTFCENCNHLINPSDVKCPNCNTATPWARKCPECGELVLITEEICPNCGFNLIAYFGKANTTYSAIHTSEEDVEICPECGNQISDSSMECPNCGYKEKKLNMHNKKTILGIVLVILCISALVISEFQLTMSRWHGYYACDDEHFISAIILYIVMLGCGIWSAIIFYKQNKLISKVLIGLMSVAILVLLYQLTIDSKLSTHDEISDREYKEYLASENNVSPSNPANSFIGTYVYIQPYNFVHDEKLIIILNEDETALAKTTRRGKERTFYGSWSSYSDGIIRITFSDTYHLWDGRTYLLQAWINEGEAINMDESVIRDGYLYRNSNYAKAKNPEVRVKLEKVN